ncbi:MAG TPA: serine/threonine-protein kinase, partial [Myxococcota bacterium]|nr:serine/threonine-protein kinase [Myxococcota bacterium]
MAPNSSRTQDPGETSGATLRGAPKLRLVKGEDEELALAPAPLNDWRNQSDVGSIFKQTRVSEVEGSAEAMRVKSQPAPQARMTSTLTPGRLLGEGKYELLSPLGRGAMGSVWLARHVALDRSVAVKLLHSGLQLGRSLASTQARRDNASERFLKEARTASLLRHKNTVQLLDYGADTADRWLVMEYLEGKNLSDVLHEAGRFPAPRAIAIVTQVLAALAEAHEYGIVHRDLKPANIMLVPWVDDDGRETELAKVLDFGIATMMSDEVADRNEVAGTPEYMSPEQAQAFDVDPRSDLYAVGILLYHLLTGDTPFRGDTPMDTMLLQVNGVPVPPRQLEPSISRELEAVILSSLAKDPDERPESARAMRAALLALPEAKGLKSDS